jgi:hypothetical protein
MKAFIEDICEHAGIIRIGPDADCFGQPFEVAVAFKLERDGDGNPVATIKALTTGLVPVTLAHTRAAIRALAERGLAARWFRITETGFGAREVRPALSSASDFWNCPSALGLDLDGATSEPS